MAHQRAHPSILVMGAGGIGGTVTAHLTEVGAEVTAVTTNQGIADAVRSRGFALVGNTSPRTVRGRIEVGIPRGTRYDYVILATQPPQVEDAARTAAPHLADDGHMVVLQNGLCEERVATFVGPERVIGAIVAWGASMTSPGIYDRTAAGGFTLGRLPGHAETDAVRALGNLLECIGPVELTDNLLGARWSKLALNSAVSSIGTLCGRRLGPLTRLRRVRRLALEIFTEAVAVAHCEGIRLRPVAGTMDLGWLALTESERASRGSPSLISKHAVLLGVGLRYRRMRSSMLSAIERGRVPAIDFLNGEIVRVGDRHQVPTPVNATIVRTIHSIARGEQRPSMETFDRMLATLHLEDDASEA